MQRSDEKIENLEQALEVVNEFYENGYTYRFGDATKEIIVKDLNLYFTENRQFNFEDLDLYVGVDLTEKTFVFTTKVKAAI